MSAHCTCCTCTTLVGVMNNLFVLDPWLCCPNGTRQDPPLSHPSRGGNPFSDKMRRMVLQRHFNGFNLQNLCPKFADLRLNNKIRTIPPVAVGYKSFTKLVIFSRREPPATGMQRGRLVGSGATKGHACQMPCLSLPYGFY
jgi:hypothetical protein